MLRNPTTQKQRALLTAAGFVRVDGLKAAAPEGSDTEDHIIKSTVNDLGRYFRGDDMIMIVTVSAEIWMAMTLEANEWILDELIGELCPDGRGTPVLQWRGEGLSVLDLFRRLADPDWQQ